MFTKLIQLFNFWATYRLERLRENRLCESCENLKTELERAHALNEKLMQKLNPTEVKEETEQAELKLLPRKGRHLPFAIKNQMMAEQDARTVELMKEYNKKFESKPELEELEKEVLEAKPEDLSVKPI